MDLRDRVHGKPPHCGSYLGPGSGERVVLLTKDRFRRIFPWAVLAVWMVSFIADVVLPSYTPPSEINAALLIVVSIIFGVSKEG